MFSLVADVMYSCFFLPLYTPPRELRRYREIERGDFELSYNTGTLRLVRHGTLVQEKR